jgi:hypothetical protein
MTETCDLCPSKYLVSEITLDSCRLRGVEKLCWDCSVQVERIREPFIRASFREGKPDWHATLVKRTVSALKKFYRKKQGIKIKPNKKFMRGGL